MPVYVVPIGRKRKRKKKKLHSGVKPKQYADRVHAKKRLEERYSVDMNRQTRLAIEMAIKTGQAEFCGRASGTRDIYKNVVPGHPDIRVVFSHKTNSPVTSLPREAKENK